MYYTNEAARLHNAAVIPQQVKEAERMRQWLLTAWSEDFITARAAAQRGPFKVTDKSRKALVFLEGYGWLVRADGATVERTVRKEAWHIVRGQP